MTIDLKPIRIFAVDDHALLSEGIAALIADQLRLTEGQEMRLDIPLSARA